MKGKGIPVKSDGHSFIKTVSSFKEDARLETVWKSMDTVTVCNCFFNILLSHKLSCFKGIFTKNQYEKKNYYESEWGPSTVWLYTFCKIIYFVFNRRRNNLVVCK